MFPTFSTELSSLFGENWPNYSDKVMGALQDGNILEEWDSFVAETAYFILRHHDIKKSNEYDEIGRLVYERYRCIGFQNNGSSQWVRIIVMINILCSINWSSQDNLL